jgi:hypothetical protein
MHRLVLAIMLCSTPAFADVAPPKPTPVKPKPAEAKFPLPKDATGGESQPGGAGKIQMHQVPRGRDAVITEVRALLKKDGWTIAKDEASPSGRAIRLEVKKGATLIKASFTGDATRTAIILTLP